MNERIFGLCRGGFNFANNLWFIRFAGAIVVALLSVNLGMPDALAQNYPSRPIRMLVGYAPGGSADVTARTVANKLPEALGQSVIVENRPGASGAIANERVVASPADGYTVVMMTASSILQAALGIKISYDLERDFSPVSLVVISPFLLVVHPSVPVRNAKELIAIARANPGRLSYGSSGLGTSPYVAGEIFNLMAKVKIVHIPYKGGSEFVVATAGGQVDMSFPGIPATQPLSESGKVKILAITSLTRSSALPSIPTLDEAGLPGYEVITWIGVLGPAGVPQDVIARLNAAIVKVVNTPDVKQSFSKQGLDVKTNTPAQFVTFIRNDLAQTTKLIKLAGVRAE